MFSEADAFLDAIWATPGDDTPRLVYADWLEEHDQPEYAQFIRVDCEIARREVMPVADRKTLRDHRFCLWRAVEARWADRLTGLNVSYQGFTRGIFHGQPCVDAVTFVSRSALWWPLLPVRDLTIYDPEGHEEEVAGCPYLARLRVLEIGDVGWHDPWAPARAIPEKVLWELARSPFLSRIEGLELGPVQATRSALDTLSAAPFMRRLAGDGFRLRLRAEAPSEDAIFQGRPGLSAAEALQEWLQEVGHFLRP